MFTLDYRPLCHLIKKTTQVDGVPYAKVTLSEVFCCPCLKTWAFSLQFVVLPVCPDTKLVEAETRVDAGPLCEVVVVPMDLAFPLGPGGKCMHMSTIFSFPFHFKQAPRCSFEGQNSLFQQCFQVCVRFFFANILKLRPSSIFFIKTLKYHPCQN